MANHISQAHDGIMNDYEKTKKKKLIGNPRKVIGKHKNGEEFPVKSNSFCFNF
jgi:hypothetical protein